MARPVKERTFPEQFRHEEAGRQHLGSLNLRISCILKRALFMIRPVQAFRHLNSSTGSSGSENGGEFYMTAASGILSSRRGVLLVLCRELDLTAASGILFTRRGVLLVRVLRLNRRRILPDCCF
ncbi:hypothetical protein CDAR_50351 [Caerostris darwini]|uniref:Uncharacterized protein n=1 Tax=Caerostris darwini TaxID=1538125 RepID=A0AAV4UXA9_9ARAC|nr:hypothetical protein CDAR_50351 [Caerostris darwini]